MEKLCTDFTVFCTKISSSFRFIFRELFQSIYYPSTWPNSYISGPQLSFQSVTAVSNFVIARLEIVPVTPISVILAHSKCMSM